MVERHTIKERTKKIKRFKIVESSQFLGWSGGVVDGQRKKEKDE